MENFVFHNPTKLIFGKGENLRIGEEIRRAGVKSVVLVAGEGSIRENGVYDSVAASLDEAAVSRVECWGVRPNPTLAKVREITDIVREKKPGGVLAVGGGSVVDSAKTVSYGYYERDIWAPFRTREPVRKALPVFVVLTLSGTGSEMDPFAVITDHERARKWTVCGPALYPRVSIVDPAVQTTLPWHLTACGAVDALSHIMEFYFSGERSNVTLSLNGALSRSMIRAADALKSDASSYQWRADLAWASTLALNGISAAGQGRGCWTVHHMEHVLSAHMPSVRHAEGLSVLFPAWIEQIIRKGEDVVFQRWAEDVWGAGSVPAAVTLMRDKFRSWGMPVSLSELGVDKAVKALMLDSFSELHHVRGMPGAELFEEVLSRAG